MRFTEKSGHGIAIEFEESDSRADKLLATYVIDALQALLSALNERAEKAE